MPGRCCCTRTAKRRPRKRCVQCAACFGWMVCRASVGTTVAVMMAIAVAVVVAIAVAVAMAVKTAVFAAFFAVRAHARGAAGVVMLAVAQIMQKSRHRMPGQLRRKKSADDFRTAVLR